MATNSPRGFWPSRNQHGSGTQKTHRYPVSANNAAALFIGDPVVLNAGGGVQSWLTADASAIGAKRGLLGVVARIYDSNGRPLTHNQPTNGPFLDASTGGFVDVYDDPDCIFIANASVTATRNHVQQLVPVAFGVYNSAAGISGAGIDLANGVVTATGNEPFQVMGLADNNLDWPNPFIGSAANNDVEVRVADHTFRRRFNTLGQDNTV